MPGRMLPKGRVKYSMHKTETSRGDVPKLDKSFMESDAPFAQAEYGGQKNGWGHEPQAESP